MTIVCVGTLLGLSPTLSPVGPVVPPVALHARRTNSKTDSALRTSESTVERSLKLMSSRSSSLSAEPEDLPSTNPHAQPGMGAVLSSWKGKDRAVADRTTETGPLLPDEVIRVANEVRSRPHCVFTRLTFLGTAS